MTAKPRTIIRLQAKKVGRRRVYYVNIPKWIGDSVVHLKRQVDDICFDVFYEKGDIRLNLIRTKQDFRGHGKRARRIKEMRTPEWRKRQWDREKKALLREQEAQEEKDRKRQRRYEKKGYKGGIRLGDEE